MTSDQIIADKGWRFLLRHSVHCISTLLSKCTYIILY